MGKRLIIYGADFSANAISTSTPVTKQILFDSWYQKAVIKTNVNVAHPITEVGHELVCNTADSNQEDYYCSMLLPVSTSIGSIADVYFTNGTYKSKQQYKLIPIPKGTIKIIITPNKEVVTSFEANLITEGPSGWQELLSWRQYSDEVEWSNIENLPNYDSEQNCYLILNIFPNNFIYSQASKAFNIQVF